MRVTDEHENEIDTCNKIYMAIEEGEKDFGVNFLMEYAESYHAKKSAECKLIGKPYIDPELPPLPRFETRSGITTDVDS